MKEIRKSVGETSDGKRKTFGGKVEARVGAGEGGKVSVRCTVNGEAVELRVPDRGAAREHTRWRACSTFCARS